MIEWFDRGVEEQLRWYVYLLIDPRDQSIFYVGKGMGQRCFAHVHEARATKADVLGDYAKLSRIREIESNDQAVHIELLRHGLVEREAFLLESACIDLLRGLTTLRGLTNISAGHGQFRARMSAAHANAVYSARKAVLDPQHSVVLIRINRTYHREMSSAEIYEATRKWWKIASWRCDLNNPGAPKWALGVANGIVRGVYEIEAWEQPEPADIAIDRRRAGRRGFRGHRDPALEEQYLGADGSLYLTSTQSPLSFYPRPV